MSESTKAVPVTPADGATGPEDTAEQLWRLWREGQPPDVPPLLARLGDHSAAQVVAVGVVVRSQPVVFAVASYKWRFSHCSEISAPSLSPKNSLLPKMASLGSVDSARSEYTACAEPAT